MSLAIEVKAIKPKNMNVSAFRQSVERGLDSGAKVIKSSFEETTATFRRKPPVRIRARLAYRLIWVDDEIYGYISKGTPIRWAIMSKDWRSKTKPGRLRPGPGRGRVVVAGRRRMQKLGIPARPGIKGRKFDKQIIKRDKSKVQKGVDKEIKSAAGRVF